MQINLFMLLFRVYTLLINKWILKHYFLFIFQTNLGKYLHLGNTYIQRVYNMVFHLTA